MKKLTTATGKTFDCDYFNVFEPARQLSIQVYNLPLVDAAAVFSNQAETVQLWHDGQYAANYTNLVSISPVGQSVRVTLRKE